MSTTDCSYFPSIEAVHRLAKDPSCWSVTIDSTSDTALLDVLEREILSQRSEFRVILHQLDGEADLSCLARLPSLRQLSLTSDSPWRTPEGIREAKKLQSLTIRSKDLGLLRFVSGGLECLQLLEAGGTHDLKDIERCSRLRELSITGPCNNFASLTQLSGLEQLSMHGCRIKDLDFLCALNRLTSIELALGSLSDLAPIAFCRVLKRVALRWLPKVTDLGVLLELFELRYLELEGLSSIKALPACACLGELECVAIENLPKVGDYHGISLAPKLKEFYLGKAGHHSVDDFDFFLTHPTLKKIGVFFGSKRKNEEFERKFRAKGLMVSKFAPMP